MRHRIRLIKRYERQAEAIQAQQLNDVIAALRGTEYAKQNGFEGGKGDYQTFRKRLPVTEYEPLRPLVERMLLGEKNVLLCGGCDRFAMSSGTSGGRSKYIPVNAAHLHRCHYRGGSDSLWLYLPTRSDSRFFATKGLVLGGSSKPVAQGNNILVGDLSSILIEKMPAIGNAIRIPSKDVLLQDEWNSKMEAIVEQVRRANVGSLSGVPSWMLVMIKSVLEAEGKENLSEVWPNLEVFFHGGISFEHYRDVYKRLIPSPRMQYRETYNASEGFFGIQNDPSDQAMLLMLDYGVFYEFTPLSELDNPEPTVIPLADVKPGVTYAMIISTIGGLYRYMIGDTVRFTSVHPYKFVIVGRTSHYINAFGEELMVANTDKAISTVSKELGASVSEYTAAPLFMSESGKGRHEWIIEFSELPHNITTFAQKLDSELRALNSDYDAKRYSDMTLLPLRLYIAPEGFFSQYLSDEGKLGGQHKVPRLRNDRTLFDKLLQRGILQEIQE